MDILLNDVKFKSGVDSRYALRGSSGEIIFNIGWKKFPFRYTL